MFFLLLLILQGVRTQDATLPSFSPRPHQLPFNDVQFVQQKPTKKGPILFPNDAPPPPPTPLIVTSRPLSESIARSELNPNNSLEAQSQYHQVTFRPEYLARGKNYEPYSYNLATVAPIYDYETSKLDYVDTARTVQGSRRENFYKDYELRLQKPLYDINNFHGQRNTAPKIDRIKYKDTPQQFYYKADGGEHDNSKEYNHGDNYAFSYTVKDKKTGDDFSHSQQSIGSATNGEYRVRLPDGRMQIVSYTADENGYKADVRYDEQHIQDNSIDIENDKEKRYENNDLPVQYKHNYDNTYNHIVNQDSFENKEYIRPQYNDDKTLNLSKRPYNSNNHNNFEHINDYGNKNDNYQHYNVYPTKTAYVDTTKVNNIDDRTYDGLSDNNNDYLDHLDHYNTKSVDNNEKVETKDDYKFSDEVPYSKEIVDYSSELDQNYQPYVSKFSSFVNKQNEQANVRPSYDELKDLFVTNVKDRGNAALPVVSTVRPVYVTPGNVVAITPKKPLYTNIRNIVPVSPVTPTSFLYSTPSPSTPRNYLLSTITNLKHQISLAKKPVLSDHYINKINKYLSYTPSKLDK